MQKDYNYLDRGKGYVDTEGLWTRAKNKETTTKVLGLSGCGAKVWEVLRPDIKSREKSETRGTGFLYSFQNCGRFSGKCSATGSLRPVRGTEWTGMGGRGSQHCFICGWKPHIGTQHNLVT